LVGSVRKELALNAKAEDVWDAVRDFGSLHTRLVPGFVTDTRLDGQDRIVTFFTGTVQREPLVELDERARRLVYCAVDSPMGATHYNASVQVFSDGEDSSRLVWVVDFLPDALADSLDAVMDRGAQTMKQTLDGIGASIGASGIVSTRTDTSGILIRGATQSDLGSLLALYEELAGAKITAAPSGEGEGRAVLAEILADPSRELAVAVVDGQLVGTADLLVVANLTHRGEPWAIVENVVVSALARRRGVGKALMEHLLADARARGCFKVQLLSGKHRAEAHAFYRSIGLSAVAEGFKIYFDEP
jgi:GNAT superfamily N-acetyltransferase